MNVSPAADERLTEIMSSIDGAYAAGSAHELLARGGLPNAFAKMERGEAVTVAYFGTSVTDAPGWRVLSFEWLQRKFPRAKLFMVNASLGGSGSIIGAFRADRDLISAKADLVFIEFAGNDNADALRQPKDVFRAMEGIVRKILRQNPATDICLVYAPGPGDFEQLLAGKLSRGATLHEIIAHHYGLPSILASLDAARLHQQGKMIISAPRTDSGYDADGRLIFTSDGSHPLPLGYKLWFDVIERGLTALQGHGKPEGHALIAPLLHDNWENAKTIPVHGNAQFDGQWLRLTAVNGPAVGKKVYDGIPFLYRTSTPGTSLTVEFTGTHIGIKGVTGPDSGIVAISVDGQPIRKEIQFTVYTKRPAYGGRPLREMPPGKHQVTWTLLAEQPDKRAILASHSRKGNEQDLLDDPMKYAGLAFYAGELLVVGEVLPAPSLGHTRPGSAGNSPEDR